MAEAAMFIKGFTMIADYNEQRVIINVKRLHMVDKLSDATVIIKYFVVIEINQSLPVGRS